LPFCKKFLLRTRIWKKAFTLGLFSGEFADSPDRLILLPRRSFRRLLVEPSTLHLPKHTLSLHFLFEDAERLVDVVVANQYLQEVIPSLRRRTTNKTARGHSRSRRRHAVGDLASSSPSTALLLLLRRPVALSLVGRRGSKRQAQGSLGLH
jgi:hypothetical protein